MFGSEVGNINDIRLINDNLLHNNHNHQLQFIWLIFSLSPFLYRRIKGRSLCLVWCVRVCLCFGWCLCDRYGEKKRVKEKKVMWLQVKENWIENHVDCVRRRWKKRMDRLENKNNLPQNSQKKKQEQKFNEFQQNLLSLFFWSTIIKLTKETTNRLQMFSFDMYNNELVLVFLCALSNMIEFVMCQNWTQVYVIWVKVGVFHLFLFV